MNKDGHVLNAVLLGLGLAVILNPAAELETARLMLEVTIPVVLGAMVPDIDTAFGKHRKTLHNLPLLAAFYAFPYFFGNLEYVWIGVLTHYVLDVVGSKRGIALFYPLSPKEYNFPTGVATSSKYATRVTVVVTAFELAVIAVIVHYQFPVQDIVDTASTFMSSLLF